MTKYKAFGSFLRWYVGPCDEISKLQAMFEKGMRREPRNVQPYMYATSSAVHHLVKDLYSDRDELSIALLKAKTVYNSPAHSSQVVQGRGWHSRNAA
jgi:hypothetical protein